MAATSGAGFSGCATLGIGDPYFFSGLAAVLVGGTALGSAHGDFTRTVMGALTLTVLTAVLTGMGIGQGDRRVLFRAITVLVVLIYGRDRRLCDRLERLLTAGLAFSRSSGRAEGGDSLLQT